MENLEEYRCFDCFYCKFEYDDEFNCTKISKIVNENPYSSEVCKMFLSYWDAFKFMEGNNV